VGEEYDIHGKQCAAGLLEIMVANMLRSTKMKFLPSKRLGKMRDFKPNSNADIKILKTLSLQAGHLHVLGRFF